jgi:hypothetical protein
MTEIRKSACSKCPSSFELIPPADPNYSEPKENPTSDDYLKRFYECEEENHQNTIYWQKKEDDIKWSSNSISNPDKKPHMSTKYGRGFRGEFDRL